MKPRMIADVVVNMIKAAGLTPSQQGELLGYVTSDILAGSVVEPVQTSGYMTQTPKITAPIAPPRGTTVQIPFGTQCICKLCKKVAYSVISDIVDNMHVEEFVACFEPHMPVETELFGDAHGNIAVDCPLCRGIKSVWIKGDGSYSDIPDGEDILRVQ